MRDFLNAARGLEERLGIRLLSRTTRSVAPTDAGDRLIARLRPALGDVELVLDEIAGLRERPAGRVRLVAPRLAAKMVVGRKLEQFTRQYPDVVLEITTDDSPLDLVAGRFDAGIHLGEYIERDMIATRVSRDQRAAIVASPQYFEAHPKPKSPRDLPNHRCINISMGSAGVYRWEFEKGSQSLAVGVQASLVIDDMDMTIRAAMDGVGWRSRSTSTWPRILRCTRARPRGLVPAVRRLLSLTTRAGGSSPTALSALINVLRLEDRAK